MYIGYGWPRALAPLSEIQESYVAVHLDATLLVAVTTKSVQILSGGQLRILLGECRLTKEEQHRFGQHITAVWCPRRRMLAVLVRAHVTVIILHICLDLL